MRAAIYTRVSTNSQNTARQLKELEEICQQKEWRLVLKESEVISGSVPYRSRNRFINILDYAKSKKIDILVVHEISRLGRNTVDVLRCIQKLNTLNVSVYILNINLEINPDRVDPSANLIVAVLASLATHEKELMQQRIISGIKSSDKRSGRREGDNYTLEDYESKYPIAVRLLKDGYKMSTVSELTKVSYSTVRRIKSKLKRNS